MLGACIRAQSPLPFLASLLLAEQNPVFLEGVPAALREPLSTDLSQVCVQNSGASGDGRLGRPRTHCVHTGSSHEAGCHETGTGNLSTHSHSAEILDRQTDRHMTISSHLCVEINLEHELHHTATWPSCCECSAHTGDGQTDGRCEEMT